MKSPFLPDWVFAHAERNPGQATSRIAIPRASSSTLGGPTEGRARAIPKLDLTGWDGRHRLMVE
jgi:hypothetical protein